MSKARSVYIPLKDNLTVKMFMEEGWGIADSPDELECDLVCFTGGSDVTPLLYGESIIKGTVVDLVRDKKEVRLWRDIPLKLPKVGICRGAQFLNVMCRGKMWQNVDNHVRRGMHDIKTMEGSLIQVTSTHHQMMRPSDEAFIVATASESKYKTCEEKSVRYMDDKPHWDDAEVLYYEHENALCFQPHPEYCLRGDACWRYFFDLLDTYQFS